MLLHSYYYYLAILAFVILQVNAGLFNRMFKKGEHRKLKKVEHGKSKNVEHRKSENAEHWVYFRVDGASADHASREIKAVIQYLRKTTDDKRGEGRKMRPAIILETVYDNDLPNTQLPADCHIFRRESHNRYWDRHHVFQRGDGPVVFSHRDLDELARCEPNKHSSQEDEAAEDDSSGDDSGSGSDDEENRDEPQNA